MQIENEFDTGATRAAYMQLLEQRLRTNGIVWRIVVFLIAKNKEYSGHSNNT